ncbi:MAG TPA: hemolysin family protein [Actinopolymorphaceae bacterium]
MITGQEILANVGLVFLFVLIGGVFAAAEIALVSLRESQVRRLEERGKRGQAVVRLTQDPNRFLSAVQVGVTLSGFLSAAFGGAVLADALSPVLQDLGLPAAAADTVALVLITIAISYFSIVLGELTAKRLALQRAEGFALALGPIIDRIARLSRPVIWFLSKSTDVAVRLFGGDPTKRQEEMTEEELRDLVSAHETLGKEERAIVGEVFAAGDHLVREVMLPLTDVDFMDANLPVFKAVKLVTERPHSRYPVVDGSSDDVVGFVHVRDLLDPELSGRSVRVGDLAREVLLLPGTKRVISALADMRDGGHHLAIVVDEYGGTAGIVTLEDLLEELIGDIRDEYDVDADSAPRRLLSGEIELDGRLNLEDVADETGIALPDGPYETLAGFLVAQLGHIPDVGESIEHDEHRFTVAELDGRRVARVRIQAIPRTERPSDGGTRSVTESPQSGVTPSKPVDS